MSEWIAWAGPKTAWAQGAAPAPVGGTGAFLTSFFPFILIFVLFYFLLIRPQQKRQKAHRTMIDEIKKGDKVVTNGGVLGTITSVTKSVITLQVSDSARLKVLRSEIMGMQQELLGDEAPASPKAKPAKETKTKEAKDK
ncbi:MAG: preprotein translocase subunit YajC [Leptospirillia bacterium]